MRIEKIVIDGFRQYKNFEISFENENDKTDLHIFIAQNGLGKTNLLNSIEWCLYDIEPHLGNDGDALPRLNISKLEESRSANEIEATIKVSLHTLHNNEKIIFERTQKVVCETGFEHQSKLKVLISKNSSSYSIYEDDQALEYVNIYFNSEIKEYFFFDGEQLNNYFITEQGSRIKDSIHSLSQVSLLSNIERKLNSVISDLKKSAGDNNKELKIINKKIEDTNDKIKGFKNDIIFLRGQIDLSNKIITDIDNFFEQNQGVDSLNREYLNRESRILDLKERKRKLEEEIKVFIQNSTIALAFYQNNRKVLQLIKDQESAGQLPPKIDKDFLKIMIEEEKCLICNRNVSNNEISFMQTLFDSFNVSSETSNTLMMIKSTLEEKIIFAENYKKMKEDLINEYSRISGNIEDEYEELQKLDKQLLLYSSEDERREFDDLIRDKQDKRIKNRELISINEQKLGRCELQKRDLEKNLEDLNKEYDKELGKKEDYKNLRNQLLFSQEAYSRIKIIKQNLMSNVRQDVEKRTLEYFKNLIWKKDTYENIKLNEEYEMKVIHKSGFSSLGSLSAAERALLALAYTLSLHDISGVNSILYIDTPVARVSDQNREQFAKVITKISEDRQIILAFTPSEYSSEIKNVFEPKISSKNILDTKDERVTYIKEA